MNYRARSAGRMTRAPWHLWVVGVLALLWNLSGLYAFVTARRGSLPAMPLDDAAYYASMEAWEVLAWYVGTMGGLSGAALLLLRSRLSVPVCIASLLSVILSHVYALTSGQSRLLADEGALVLSLVVLVPAILLLEYALRMRRRRVLR